MSSTFPRIIENKVKKQLSDERATVVTGMRRVGKTTLVRRVFDHLETDNKRWFDLENPLDIKQFEEVDYNHVIDNLRLDRGKRMFVFIDEIQHFPQISKIMKYLIDHYRIKFIVTGSASYYLKSLFPESMAGRKQIFELFPLNFEEFLIFKGVHYQTPKEFSNKSKLNRILDYEKLSKVFVEFFEFGGFPEVVLEANLEEKKLRLKEIFSSYYEKEVLGLSGFRKSREVRDLIILLAARIGSKLDVTKISQELGINRVTLNNYIYFLEMTYFISLVYPFSRSVDREVSGRPKVYFCDNGLASVISQVNRGQLLENVVFNLLKFYGKINYYQRRRSEQEIDFILDQSIALEAKETASRTDLNRLQKLARDLRLNESYLVSLNFVKDLAKVIYPQFL